MTYQKIFPKNYLWLQLNTTLSEVAYNQYSIMKGFFTLYDTNYIRMKKKLINTFTFLDFFFLILQFEFLPLAEIVTSVH